MPACSTCGVDKPTSEYYYDNSRGIRRKKCKECTKLSAKERLKIPEVRERRRAYERNRNASNPNLARKKYLKLYGLTALEDYESLLASQGGCCAICGTTSPGGVSGRFFSIDHDHDCCTKWPYCGQCIRGLLCNNCNVVLGHAKDDVGILFRAIQYLIDSRKYLKCSECGYELTVPRSYSLLPICPCGTEMEEETSV